MDGPDLRVSVPQQRTPVSDAPTTLAEQPLPPPDRPTPAAPSTRSRLRQAARATRAWAKQPKGRVILPATIVLVLLGASGTAGAYLVPNSLSTTKKNASATGRPGELGNAANGLQPGQPAPGQSGAGPGLPGQSGVGQGLPGQSGAGPGLPSQGGAGQVAAGGQAVPGQAAPGQAAPGQVAAGGVAPGKPGQAQVRPPDALAGWALQVGTRVGIPVVAVQAYGYAELVLARTTPNCHLNWTTIAAIGKIESAHGSFNGSVLGANGTVQPPIYGLPLDGQGGRQLVRDTDQGTLDKDTTYDRAIGPMQFIPSTWLATKVDADNDGVADPNDINDAALTAGVYLCKYGRDLSKADSWWAAILSYNAVQPYAQKVFDAANDYGVRSRS